MEDVFELSTKLTSRRKAFLSEEEVRNCVPAELLGEGAAGRVFAVSDDSRFPAAVLKIARDAQAEVSLLNEARALTLLGGSCAPLLLGLGRLQGGRLALLMERAPGASLRTHLASASSDMPSRRALAWTVLVSGGHTLQQLHAWGMSHGDFKPENVQVELGSPNRLTLIDLGLSAKGRSISGGTPRYMPPRALEGRSVSPFDADLFALAMTVAEVLLPEEWALEAAPAELASALPAPFDSLLGPVLESGARAVSLRWLLEQAMDSGSVPGDETLPSTTEEIRREYVATRLLELESTRLDEWELSPGLRGQWVESLVRRFEVIRRCGEGDFLAPPEGSPLRRSDMSQHDRGRFLGRLIGPVATNWRFQGVTDDQLLLSLEALGRKKPLRSAVYAELGEALLEHTFSPPVVKATDAYGCAMALGRRPVARDILLWVEKSEVPEEIRVEAARAARQMGDLPLAERLACGARSSAALLEQAIVASRKGESERAASLREQALGRAEGESSRSCVLAQMARADLDGGDAGMALARLESSLPLAPVQEVRALALLSRGEGERALEVAGEGLSVSTSDEEMARLTGVQGMILHFLARPEESLGCFSRACEISARASAALEEATFATGLAAAATDLGHLGAALEASERAEVLFESLGLGMQTGRALLARAAVLSALGMRHDAWVVARRGLSVSQRAGDRLCEAYLCLCICDALLEGEGRLHFARQAKELVKDGSADDKLRVASRLIACGEKVDSSALEWARESESREALVEWYGARAEALERLSSHSTTDETRQTGREIVGKLIELAHAGPPLLVLGPALIAGAHLGLRLGVAEEARRLFDEARNVAEILLRHVAPAHRAIAQELTWVQQARGSRVDSESGAAQLSDVESLLRALSQRRGFRALLDQTLDLLLLWTRVERGLLLLRAPGQKLVVRAARNLDRRDLSEEQRALSFSMAERALREGRPVVAVDAVNDLSAIHRSVHSLHLRSVLAVPLAARGEVLGVAYLDDRIRRGAFGENELSWVGLIGTIAALAILDERDRLSLKRAARRAHRAEKRLAERLTDREAQLELAERELSRVAGERKLRGDYSHIIGRSQAMYELLQLVDRVSQSDIPALICGESGTGKELIARAVASSGPRKDKAFVAENCSAVPETLLESTLFGHKKGAFTGATRDQAGLFELAHRGTLFLDEIGDMPLSMQTKLLRVLQEGEVRALGASRTQRVDVRVIVATHKDLKTMVAAGTFREDLYYRLNVVTLRLPPLRERREDIAPLLDYFLEKYSQGKRRRISEPALHRLIHFSWPGNVRQLENEVRRMVVLGGEELTAADLSPEVLSDSFDLPEARTLKDKVDFLERRLVMEALEEARGNRTHAAETLGLSRFGLQKMIQRLAIQSPKNAKAGRKDDRGLDET